MSSANSLSKANVGKRKDWRWSMTTVEVAPRGPRPPIRVRPVPRCDPPFDDELEPQMWATANQLALEWPTPTATQPPPDGRQPIPNGGQPPAPGPSRRPTS